MFHKVKKPRKVRQKKKKNGVGNCRPGKYMVFGGGKCPNLGVANVRILGVANVVLANDTQSSGVIKVYSKTFGCLVVHVIHVGLCINSVVGCH